MKREVLSVINSADVLLGLTLNKYLSLRKHAYTNIPKIFQVKNSDMFHISVQNIDRRSGSNAYPQSMFLSRNKKNNVTVIPP